MVERARAPRPSVSDLESLLSEVPRLAYDPVEVSYLTKVLDEARGISAHVTRVFPHVAWSPTVRGGMTLILRKNATSSNTNLRKSTLMELQSLLSSIHSCPVKLVERDRLVEHLIHAEKWISRCHHAIDSQNRNLKDLASLASEAESIPIDLSSPHVVLPQADVAWRIGIASMSDVKSKNKNEMNLIAPTPMTTPRTRLPNAWSVNAMEGKKANNATTVNNTDLPSDVSAAVRTAEIARREQLTSWEQLRLNAARQRETILERTQGLNTVYRQLNSKLRVRTLRGEEHKKNSLC